MSLELARGGEWNGRKLVAAPVLYLVGEGSPSFVERLESWQEFHQEPLPEMFYSAHLEPVPQLMEPNEMKALSELVKRRFGTMASNGLTVLDTFQTTTVGLEENSGREVTLAIEELQGLRRETKSTVLTAHHAGKDLGKGQRGHSSLGASMETEIEITKEPKSTVVRARLVKMRAAADGTEREYRLNYVQLEPRLEDRAEALALGLPAEMRSVPVLTESGNVGGPLESRHEKILVAMLEGYDLPDGLKRSDVERELNLKRSQAGKVLTELSKSAYVTNESRFSNKTSGSAYWLTDSGRSVAESVLRRRAGAAVEQATSREEEF
jgi:DNA-binding MarR family transcriptional regulator